jgi:hypothetical protein
MKIYVATVAPGDDVNEPMTGVLGAFSTERRPWEVAVCQDTTKAGQCVEPQPPTD